MQHTAQHTTQNITFVQQFIALITSNFATVLSNAIAIQQNTK